MAVGISSRYRSLGVIVAPGPDGVPRASVPIRRSVRDRPATVPFRHRVTGAEDIEYLAWRLSGSSERWWRIADENPLAFPLDLRPGDALNLPRDESGLIPNRGRRF